MDDEKVIDEQILSLYGEQRWKDIVNLNCTLNKSDRSRLFWVLPTINDLQWIKEVIDRYDLSGIASIGCGCGVLEWLFQKYSGPKSDEYRCTDPMPFDEKFAEYGWYVACKREMERTNDYIAVYSKPPNLV